MSYYHLNPAERFCIYKLHVEQKGIREIARFISRSPSTISREIKRNTLHPGGYWCGSAQKLARERKKIPRTQKRKEHAPLYDVVIKGLIEGFSPEIISGRLKREFRSLKMRISPEAIYAWIYADSKQEGVLHKLLVRSHKSRRKQRYSKRRRVFKDRVSIQDRPKVIETKARIGDWESDSVEGAKSKGALATHVERKSRFLVAGKLKNRSSKVFMDTSISLFREFDKRLIKSLW